MIYYQVRLSPEASAGLERLPARVAAAGINFIREQLIKRPETLGLPLSGSLKGRFVVKREQYRIIYRVDHAAGMVDILQIL
jgi:mRNA interferase RelE/StbE